MYTDENSPVNFHCPYPLDSKTPTFKPNVLRNFLLTHNLLLSIILLFSMAEVSLRGSCPKTQMTLEVYMQVTKVSCTQCTHYKDCSQKTRMYVNYCGSDRKRVESSVKDAVLECRARQGRLLKRGFYVDATTAHTLEDIVTAIS